MKQMGTEHGNEHDYYETKQNEYGWTGVHTVPFCIYFTILQTLRYEL